jgi:uncharacterized cupin superfamily protein
MAQNTAQHFQCHVSGRVGIRLDDRAELVIGPGDVTSLPSGHDVWRVSDEPAVTVDRSDAGDYSG